MATSIDKESVREAYNKIRDDSSEENWAVFKYDGNRIVMSATGVDYAEFLSLFDGKCPVTHLVCYLTISLLNHKSCKS